jgi:tetratricopeptide (TPR) repeat protein
MGILDGFSLNVVIREHGRTMDRKTRGRYGALALVAVVTIGCGVDGVSPSTQARKEPARAHIETGDQATADASTDCAASSTPQNPAAQIVEVVSTPPFEASAAVERENGASSVAGDAQDVAVVSEPSNAEATTETLTPIADTDPSEAVALDDDPDAAAADSQAESEIRFASPPTAEPIADEPAVNKSPHHGGPRHSIIELAIQPKADLPAVQPKVVAIQPKVDVVAIRPKDDVPNEAPQTEAPLEEPTEREMVPPPKTDLTPLVVTPRAAPAGRPQEVAQALPAVPQNPLPPVRVSPSPTMIATLARADERVRHGIQLAEKGALYAARKEFTSAIKLIAQAHDVEQSTRQHMQAAIAGFHALKEANEFVNSGAALREIDVAGLVAGHTTPVLKDADVMDMPSSIAAQYYYGYAKEQLAIAAARETVGSIALYGLGKIIIAGAGPNSQQLEYTGPAMALYQAALIAEPQNYRAAHELGVLLAGTGQLEMARQMLMTSATASAQPTAWRNLASIQARLGEQQLAEQAQQQAAALQLAHPETKAPPVQWVDPATFSRTVPATDILMPPAAVQAPAATLPAPAKMASESSRTPANTARTGSNRWNPLNLRR